MVTSGPYKETLAGNRYLITCVDDNTKSVESFSVKNKQAEIVAHFFLDEIIPRFSFTYQMRSDNGTEYCNQVIDYICRFYSVGKITTLTYNPQANGQVERVNTTLNDMIFKRISEGESNWDLHVNACLTAIDVYHESALLIPKRGS